MLVLLLLVIVDSVEVVEVDSVEVVEVGGRSTTSAPSQISDTPPPPPPRWFIDTFQL